MKIDPKSVTLSVGETEQFSVVPPTPGATYSVQGQSGGKIDASGHYTAGQKEGTDTITVKSPDGRSSDTATAIVTA